MMTSKEPFLLLDYQTAFITDFTHRYVGLIGGPGSGKTIAAVHKAVKLAFKNKGFNGALMEPTQGMIRGTLLPAIEYVLQETLGWTERSSDNKRGEYTYRKSNPESLVIHFPEGDSIIYLCGAENYRRLVGKNLAWFIIDEIDMCTSKQIAMEAFKEATKRLRTGNFMQGCITTTPEGYAFSHWFFDENRTYLDGPKKGQVRTDRKSYHSKTADNPFVPTSYVKSLRENLPPREAEALLNGLWANLRSGNVYYAFDRTLNCTTKTIDDFRNVGLIVGMDFNYDNMSAVIMAHDSMTGCTYVVEEITGEKNTESMIRRLKKDYAHWAQYPKGITIYPDSSGKSPSANSSISSISMLRQAGFECVFKGNNPSIMKERVPAVNAQFSSQKQVNGEWVVNQRLFVNIEKCPVLVKGLEQQGFGPDGKPDKSGGLDHCLDALGYPIAHLFPVPGKGSISVYR